MTIKHLLFCSLFLFSSSLRASPCVSSFKNLVSHQGLDSKTIMDELKDSLASIMDRHLIGQRPIGDNIDEESHHWINSVYDLKLRERLEELRHVPSRDPQDLYFEFRSVLVYFHYQLYHSESNNGIEVLNSTLQDMKDYFKAIYSLRQPPFPKEAIDYEKRIRSLERHKEKLESLRKHLNLMIKKATEKIRVLSEQTS